MYDSVPHTRSLLVTGALSEEQSNKAKGMVSSRRSTYQGPTSIVNLVTETMIQHEISTTSLMAHLPQYMQLHEDHMGASRIVEVLCAIYDLPRSLADPTRGQQQYREINKAVENNSEVSDLIKQLEAYYDRVLAGPDGQDGQQDHFAPDVERFLLEMGERLESSEEAEDPDDDEE
jgi:hypothetical protein